MPVHRHIPWTAAAASLCRLAVPPPEHVFVPLADEESVLMVWNSTMPMEVKDLRRHCEKREQIAAKMREQLHHD